MEHRLTDETKSRRLSRLRSALECALRSKLERGRVTSAIAEEEFPTIAAFRHGTAPP